MRNVLLLILLLTTIAGPLFAGDEGIKAIAPFLVVSSEKDPALSDSEALFEFEVMNPEFREEGANPAFSAAWNFTNGFPFLPGADFKTELKVPSGTYSFQFFTYCYIEIYAEQVEIQPGYRTKVQLRFTHASMETIADKPVIYLYPEKDTEVSVTVAPKKDFLFTYPAYENGWKGTAHPDGSMTIGGKTYPYLFWESESEFNTGMIRSNEGAVVEKENTVAFLEDALAQMGLSDREQADFITYWGPRMLANERNYVHFLFNDDVNQFAALNIDPQPGNLFRVYMIWWPVPSGVEYAVAPQVIRSVDRSGFYAVEWGGSEVPREEKAFAGR